MQLLVRSCHTRLLAMLLTMQLSFAIARPATGQDASPLIGKQPAARYLGTPGGQRRSSPQQSRSSLPSIGTLPPLLRGTTPTGILQWPTSPRQLPSNATTSTAPPLMRTVNRAPNAPVRQFAKSPSPGPYRLLPMQTAAPSQRSHASSTMPWKRDSESKVPARYIGQRKSTDPLDFSQLALPTTDGTKPAPEQVQAKELDQEELPTPLRGAAPKRNGSGFDPLSALPPSALGAATLNSGQPRSPQEAAEAKATAEAEKKRKEADEALKYSGKPTFSESAGPKLPQHIDGYMRPAPYDPSAFSSGPFLHPPTNPAAEISIYRCKHEVPTQRPWVELWRPQYTGGIYPEPLLLFGEYNPMQPHFIAFGDFRTGVGINQGVDGDNFNWSSQLNLNMDLRLTATERIFAFAGPLDNGQQSTRLDFTDDFNFISHTDLTFDSLFFEGDVGSIVGGFNGHDSAFDLPISFGLLPLFYQNGTWAADNVIGGVVALPARHSKFLRWSNFDATFFFALDKISSDAFVGDDNAAELFGTTWFIDAYDGHIEVNYAWVHDDAGQHRSYHNFGVGFTRRYFQRISNSIRFITNFNQSLSRDQRTADGHLLLFENSLISAKPNTVVPYLNFFYGQGRTQSLARAAAAGGVLFNTGINFASDALTGFPTLDATAVNTTGAALGINILGDDFSRQLVLEAATVAALGDRQFRNAAGNQFGLGVRYQQALNNFTLFRTDHMYGFLGGQQDITGSRIELRFKY